MRIVKLSDHAADVLKKRETERTRQYERKMAEYEAAIKERRNKHLAVMEAMANRFRYGFYWEVAKLFWRLIQRLLEPGPVVPSKALPDDIDAIWEAGQEGQELTINYLKERLDDSWTLYAGYRNQKGEIDALLVGPEGFFAIEIKHINGIISCDGDHWWKARRDSNGYIVAEDVTIADSKGRSPSRQLNEPADVLDNYIANRISGYPSRRMVIITHPSAELGSFDNVTIDSIKLLEHWDVPREFEHLFTSIPTFELDLINEFIQKSHRQFAGQRRIHQKTSGGLI